MIEHANTDRKTIQSLEPYSFAIFFNGAKKRMDYKVGRGAMNTSNKKKY